MNLINLLLLLVGIGIIVGIGYYLYMRNQTFKKKYFNDYKYSYDKDGLKIDILFGKNGIMNITSSSEELNNKNFSYYIGETVNKPPIKNVIFMNNSHINKINDNIIFFGIYATNKEDINSPVNKKGGLTLVSSKIGSGTDDNPFIMPIINSDLLINCKSESLIKHDIGICDYS